MRASREFLETSISHRQKQIFMKFELLEYSPDVDDFILMDTQIVEQRHLSRGVEAVQGGISINLEQDIAANIDLSITNHEGINNWSADFDNQDSDDFKWWLDKRMNVYMGLRLDNSDEIEYVQKGQFVITHFRSIHSLTEYPVTEIQGSSKEVLYASRRGKFVTPYTIQTNTNMIEVLEQLMLGGGEKDYNIHIDPTISKDYLALELGENLYGWEVNEDFQDIVSLSLDTDHKVHGDSSLKIEVDAEDFMDVREVVLAEKTFDFPVDITRLNSLAAWARCTTGLPDGAISILLTDVSGEIMDVPLRWLMGHVIEDGEVMNYNTWRNMLLPVEEKIDIMSRVEKLSLRVNINKFEVPFTLWLDRVYGAEVRNLTPYTLNYGAGQNRWQAVTEIAQLLDCRAYFDEQGKFYVEKNKFPVRRGVEGTYFDWDMFEDLQPVITYSNEAKINNPYAGTSDVFEEHELSNHMRVLGGSTASTVSTLVDIALYDDGLHIREKGKTLNSRGKIRAADQFWGGAEPTILNGSTDVDKVWFGHRNHDSVMEMYPDGFPELEESPVNNFAIERIGDFVYHHNNANPDPRIWYTYEAKNIALYDLRNKLAYSEQLDLLSIPYYILKGGDIIRVKDTLLDLDENFRIKSMTIPFDGNYMSISAVKLKNFMPDIPFFDVSPIKHTACFYGYDGYGLTFTYPLHWKD